jgi:hypothetical protein
MMMQIALLALASSTKASHRVKNTFKSVKVWLLRLTLIVSELSS